MVSGRLRPSLHGLVSVPSLEAYISVISRYSSLFDSVKTDFEP